MVEITCLTKTYGEIRALDSLSLSISRGEVFGLLGPNGAGKTTLIKVLTALSQPDSGHATINGFDVLNHPLEIKKRVGVVPQENNLDRELTAFENLLIYAMLHDVKDRREKIREALETVGLWERKDSVTSQFSGGMQRRLLLARAMLSEPSVLFLDEPSIGLDPQIRRHFWDIIRTTKKEGRTVVITTHYIEEAEALSDRIGILSQGKLVALDSSQNLKETVGEYVVEFVNGEGKLIQHMCKSREEAHAVAERVESAVTIRGSSLEDVFIRLTGERIE